MTSRPEDSRRILLFGNSGSGKSTLARHLCQHHGLAHLDLDTLAWQSTSPPRREALAVSGAALAEFTSTHRAWVIEGCYADLLELAAPEANEAIYLALPVADCIANARSRPWEPHKYSTKAAQDANLEMLLSWIGDYESRDDTFSALAHRQLFDAFDGRKSMHIRNGEYRDV